MLTLEIKNRTEKESLDSVRAAGFIPAVYYGPKEKATSIAIAEKDFMKIWKQAGETTLIVLKDGATEKETLIQDVDLDPITGTPRHADFYVFEKGKKLRLKVPLEYVGVSAGVKDFGGILVKVLHALEIEAEPKNLPHTIAVDLSALSALHTSIHAGDITLPAGVTLVSKKEDMVASVSAPKEEKEEEAPVDLTKIEISDKKGKKEEEGAEGEATEEKK